uniref:Uncharacterized protein n=1 Tax=Ixodes scapularis TaxID=6945 RepID=A0A4D5RXD3_IXOSC
MAWASAPSGVWGPVLACPHPGGTSLDLGKGRLLQAGPRIGCARAEATARGGPPRKESDPRVRRSTPLSGRDGSGTGVRLGRQRPRTTGQREHDGEPQACPRARPGGRQSHQGCLRVVPQCCLDHLRDCQGTGTRPRAVCRRQGPPRSVRPRFSGCSGESGRGVHIRRFLAGCHVGWPCKARQGGQALTDKDCAVARRR